VVKKMGADTIGELWHVLLLWQWSLSMQCARRLRATPGEDMWTHLPMSGAQSKHQAGIKSYRMGRTAGVAMDLEVEMPNQPPMVQNQNDVSRQPMVKVQQPSLCPLVMQSYRLKDVGSKSCFVTCEGISGQSWRGMRNNITPA
jgi:hypothetical protein